MTRPFTVILAAAAMLAVPTLASATTPRHHKSFHVTHAQMLRNAYAAYPAYPALVMRHPRYQGPDVNVYSIESLALFGRDDISVNGN
jgi:hypothetical protein